MFGRRHHRRVAGAVNPPAASCPVCFAAPPGSRPSPSLPDSPAADCTDGGSAVSRRSRAPNSRAARAATTTRTRINPMRQGRCRRRTAR